MTVGNRCSESPQRSLFSLFTIESPGTLNVPVKLHSCKAALLTQDVQINCPGAAHLYFATVIPQVLLGMQVHTKQEERKAGADLLPLTGGHRLASIPPGLPTETRSRVAWSLWLLKMGNSVGYPGPASNS